MAAPWVLLVQLRQVRSSPAGESAAFRGRAGQDVVTVRSKAHAGNDLARSVSDVSWPAHCCRCADRRRSWRRFHPEILPWTVADAVARIDRRLAVGGLGAEIGAPGLSARAVALPMLAMLIGALEGRRGRRLAGPCADDKNVMLGACGSCGAAGAGGCCAWTPDVTPIDASASAAQTSILGLFISLSPWDFLKCRAAMVAIFCHARKGE